MIGSKKLKKMYSNHLPFDQWYKTDYKKKQAYIQYIGQMKDADTWTNHARMTDVDNKRGWSDADDGRRLRTSAHVNTAL